MCQYLQKRWSCGCARTLEGIACKPMLSSNSAGCSGERYITESVDYFCTECQPQAAGTAVELAVDSVRALFARGPAVAEILRRCKETSPARKIGGFLDLYR